MAAPKSTPAPLLAPNVARASDQLAGNASRPDLSVVLGELSEAICIVETTCRALEAAQEQRSISVTPYCVTLRHGLTLINAACTHLDLATVASGVVREAVQATSARQRRR